MNVHLEHTTVTLMPSASRPKDRSTACVIQDTLEMESRVLVSEQHNLQHYNPEKQFPSFIAHYFEIKYICSFCIEWVSACKAVR